MANYFIRVSNFQFTAGAGTASVEITDNKDNVTALDNVPFLSATDVLSFTWKNKLLASAIVAYNNQPGVTLIKGTDMFLVTGLPTVGLVSAL